MLLTEDGEDVVGPAGLEVRGTSFSSCHTPHTTRHGRHSRTSKLSMRMTRLTCSDAAASQSMISGRKRSSIMSHLRQETKNLVHRALSIRRVPGCTGSIHLSSSSQTGEERRLAGRSNWVQVQTERRRFEREASPSVWRRSETLLKAGVDARVRIACKRRASLDLGFQRDP